MNILIIHNDNLPESFSKTVLSDRGINVSDNKFELQPTDKDPLDTSISNSLRQWLVNEKVKYDIIILPFSTTEHQLEYTGVRIAAHIRLTKEWIYEKKFVSQENEEEKPRIIKKMVSAPNKYIGTPILFWGPESKEDVVRFSNLGNLLLSYNIYTTSETKNENIIDCLKNIQNTKIDLPDNYDDIIKEPEYKDLLNRLSGIRPPANYTTHHSIANEWAIMRWTDMIAWDDRGKPQIKNGDFQNMLYFKYLLAKVDQQEKREEFHEYAKKISPKMEFKSDNKKKFKIVYIDDEVEKGWGKLLRYIVEKSDAELLTYPFDKHKAINKDDLLLNIEKYIEEVESSDGGADCYIIDLRLHDEDFNNNLKQKELSGYKLLSKIKSINPATPSVFFTASNKIWNFQQREANKISNNYLTNEFNDYIIKESPEQKLTRDQSKMILKQFKKAIENACSLSYLKSYYLDIKKWEKENTEFNFSLLHEFVHLLLIDNNENKVEIIKAASLTLNVFIEKYIKEFYELICDGDYVKQIKKKINGAVPKNCEDKYYLIKDIASESIVGFTDKRSVGGDSSKKVEKLKKSDLSTILIALKEFYNIDDYYINEYIKFRKLRNDIAHEAEEVGKVPVLELRNKAKQIYEFIIRPVLNSK